MNAPSRQAPAAAAALADLPGLGPRSSAMLAAAGIHTVGQLRALGAAAAFVRVRRAGQSPSLNLLWALEGALAGTPWATVARTERTRLLLAVEDLAARQGGGRRIAGAP